MWCDTELTGLITCKGGTNQPVKDSKVWGYIMDLEYIMVAWQIANIIEP